MSPLLCRSADSSSVRTAEPFRPRLLADADVRASWLRRSARRACRQAWFEGRGGGLQLEIGRRCAVRRDALLIVVTTPLGAVSLVAAPEEWPALATAGSLPEGERRRAVASLLLREHFAALNDTPFSADLQTITSSEPADSGVSLRCQGASLRLLHIDDQVLAKLESCWSRTATTLPSVLLGMSVPARVFLGSRPMTSGVIRTVRHGDVVLLPAPPQSSGWAPAVYPAICAWGDGDTAGEFRTIRARVLIQNDTMTFLEKPSRKPLPEPAAEPSSTAISEPSSAPSSAPASALPEPSTACDLDGLELLVQFEFDGPLLRLSDIAHLDADDVLELGVPVEQARVRISVSRQTVGVGEMVVVAGRLGVRVVHMKLGDGAGVAA